LTWLDARIHVFLSRSKPWMAGTSQDEPGHDAAHGNPAMKPRFVPTARQTNWLLCVGSLSVGWALWLRYRALEFSDVSLACQAGLDTWLCGTFRAVIVLYNHSVFGAVAVGAALLNLLRPSLPLFAITLAAAGFGIVLHNPSLSALGAALLVVSLARPAPAPE
jgi:hypothetical protein